MSRKGSGKGKKGSAKSPKVQIKELTEQNAILNEELIALKNQHEELRAKLVCTVGRVLDGVSRRDFNLRPGVEALDIPTDTLLAMVGSLIVKRRIYNMSVEAQVEQLEARLTHMTAQLARSTKKTRAYEAGLQDLLHSPTIEDVRDRVYQLQLIAGQEYHVYEAEDKLSQRSTSPPMLRAETESPRVIMPDLVSHSLCPSPGSATHRIQETATRLNLTRPLKRFPGNTSIKNMHRDLRLLIMKELSLEKESGADWRMLAGRLGIGPEMVEYWRSLRLACPMGRVMAEWATTGPPPSTTLRMLHRHLISPQMRCTLLAKRIADFYHVD